MRRTDQTPENNGLPIIFIMSPLLFFPSSDKEKGRKHSGPSKEEAAMKSGFFWQILKKLREVEDNLISLRSPSFHRRMNEFIAINASIEKAQALE